ncbi:MAG TPA: hypothetical protein ENK16_07075 [Chromatiales bacterium]|nr:hypothetical protein [Chromatiales bacterium]
MTTRGFPWLLLALTIAGGLLPHPANVTPVGALGLFAGAYASARYAWLVPVAALLTANLVNGFYDLTVLVCVYLGMLAGPLFGHWLLRRRRHVSRISAAVIASALTFYLISNFGVWLAGMYPPDAAGLAQCYLNGLPYLVRSLLGDAAYTALLFGGWELANCFARQRSVQGVG